MPRLPYHKSSSQLPQINTGGWTPRSPEEAGPTWCPQATQHTRNLSVDSGALRVPKRSQTPEKRESARACTPTSWRKALPRIKACDAPQSPQVVARSHSSEALASLLSQISPIRCLPVPVLLHVYDVSRNASIQQLNGLFANRHSSLKLGGLFHVGIEVLGVEWSFGWNTEGTGVEATEPRGNSQHNFRETVSLPSTQLSISAINETIRALHSEYQGPDYCLLRRNCCHFAEDFSQRLGVGPIPTWVHRFAKIGDRVERASSLLQDSLSEIRLS